MTAAGPAPLAWATHLRHGLLDAYDRGTARFCDSWRVVLGAAAKLKQAGIDVVTMEYWMKLFAVLPFVNHEGRQRALSVMPPLAATPPQCAGRSMPGRPDPR
jgi:hypothetical protein